MKKIILFLLTILLIFEIANATNGCNEPTIISTGDSFNIVVGPTVNASNHTQILSATCYLTMKRQENNSLVLSSALMDSTSDGFNNYTYNFAYSGTYPWYTSCVLGSESGSDSGCFKVSTSINDNFNILKTGMQSNTTFINTSLTTRFNNLPSNFASYVLSSLGFTIEQTLKYILNNATTIQAQNLSATSLWSYRINRTTCDTNITVNESPQACGQLNSIYKRP
jgi:hypothetical protein